ncbi:MAG: acyl-CoA thioesterase, partial [Actinomycetota bacterium]|nr:acyl-CoA thioesterase [Actinomycetota bacterium]
RGSRGSRGWRAAGAPALRISRNRYGKVVTAEVRIPIRWRDVDAYGHVNNAVFLNYLEEARDRLVESLFGEHAWDFVIARVAIDYRRELSQTDREVVVRCLVTGFGTSSVRTAERVLAADGRLSAEAESVIVARDPATGRSRPLTDAEKTILQGAVEAGEVDAG